MTLPRRAGLLIVIVGLAASLHVHLSRATAKAGQQVEPEVPEDIRWSTGDKRDDRSDPQEGT